MLTKARSWKPWLVGVLAIALLAIITPGCSADDAEPKGEGEKAAAADGENGEAGTDAGSHGGAHETDLMHANATANLNKPEEFKYDLAIWTFIHECGTTLPRLSSIWIN